MTVIPRLVSVVLNDETLRESLSRAIRVEGHRAAAFGDGASAWGEASTRDTPALAIVEIDIPGGEALCRRYRDWSSSMALVVVMESEELLERVEERDLSADDYLAKPFSVREMVSRIKVLVRRVGLVPGAAHAWEERPLMLGALTVDPVRLTAHWNGQDVGLTVTEFMLMHALVRRTGVVKTREQLMQEAFPDHAAGADRMIDAYIKRLQQRFLRVDPKFDALEGVHGAGYRYRTGR